MGLFFALSPENAKLSSVHFCKNIILPKHITASMVISELGRLNLTKRLDLNRTDYRNEGHAVRFHANSYEVVFYDKIKDLEQSRISERRAIESDNLIQADLLSNLPRPFEVLRMEVRLNSRAKIKRLCHKLGIKPPLTFEEALNRKTSQTILLHFWNQIMSEAKWLQFEKQRPEELLQEIVKNNPDIRPSRALQILGLIMATDAIGTRGMTATATLKRLQSDMSMMERCKSITSALKKISNDLERFDPIKLPNTTGTQKSELLTGE
jgi:hypothetical protein